MYRALVDWVYQRGPWVFLLLLAERSGLPLYAYNTVLLWANPQRLGSPFVSLHS